MEYIELQKIADNQITDRVEVVTCIVYHLPIVSTSAEEARALPRQLFALWSRLREAAEFGQCFNILT